jgi:hypothetical protein
MVVRVRRRFVVLTLVVLAATPVSVDESRVVVVVLVVVGSMLELPEDPTGVVMRHVVVVVGVDDAGVGMLMLDIADDALHRLRLSHGDTSV